MVESDYTKQIQRYFSVRNISLLIISIAVVFSFAGYYFGEKFEHHDQNKIHRFSKKDKNDHSNDSFRDLSQFSSYTNPRLKCGDIESFSNSFAYGVKDKVTNFISTQKNKNPAIKYVSVYFRDLNAGPIFGINEQDKFIPGSLLKLPLMMSVLKKAESEPDFLSKRYKFNIKEDDYDPFFKPRKTIVYGETYTISELLNSMIVYSDNNATLFLNDLLSEKEFKETYEELGIEVPSSSDYDLTVQTYASFFRILYNASYISPTMSGKALRLLSDTDFEEGLVAELPSDLSVAHKFGERTGFGLNQLHDCGIIYYPDHPYILCVMTRGENFPDLAKTISGISKLVYDEVDQSYKE